MDNMKKAHKTRVEVTPKYLKSIFYYDRKTGLVYRRPKVIGSFDGKDRLIVTIKGKQYQLHRVIWAINYGKWPNKDIDHLDMNPMNNRIGNLRLSSPSENLRNRKHQINNKSGYKGVFFNKQKNKWQAKICVNKTHINLGFFNDPRTAYNSYCKASKKYHGKFGRTK